MAPDTQPTDRKAPTVRDLDTLVAVSQEMLWPTTTHTVPGPHPCPVHGVGLVTHRADTYAGWFELTVCPAFDGTCQYDPDITPTAIDAPELETAGAD